MRAFLFFTFVGFFQFYGSTQTILLDENFDDWNQTNNKYIDKIGDGIVSGIDITDVRFENDENYFFVYFDLNKEINIQENNSLSIFIDLDNNSSSGLSYLGIGADLVYNFGSRSGKFYKGNSSTNVFHDKVGLITSPTVTSSRFELCFLREFSTNFGSQKMGETVKVVISDESFGGDKAPDITGGITYTFKNQVYIPKSFDFQKSSNEHLRIMSYNVLRDKLFDLSVRQNYSRIFKAVSPDIIGLCEIYDNSSSQTAALIETFIPSVGNQQWYHSGVNPDIKVISRYPIINSRSIDGNGAFLIDIEGKKMVFIVAHLPCCENEIQRQMEVDNIMSFVRSVRFGISIFQVPQNTPIVIVGDMNLVGQRQQQQTFLTGDINNNNNFGPDFDPDWDESNLEDASPLTTNLPFTFTWYNNFGTYSAGRLDYIFYTGSVMDVANSFTLWSPILSPDQLLKSGLFKDDVPKASDHCPVICDFTNKGIHSFTNHQNTTYEPFKFRIVNGQIYFSSELSGQLLITDTSGKKLYEANKQENIEEIYLDIENLSGLLILQFYTKNQIFITKFYR